MYKYILPILTALLICRTPARAQHWQQKVNYSIDVTLTDSTRSLDGYISIQYINNSPDTLTYIWIHCWPNAYKNDRTAFSEQRLGNGQTDFYFSNKDRRGYVNHLEFRADGQLAQMEDHPQYIDIVRVILPVPLAPGTQVTLTTPFHVRLPYEFSRSGYHNGAYQVTQWYPKPAVYDSHGWHPIAYLDQGEFYSEFGDFDVRITVPKSFIVAATGELQDTPGRQESGLPPPRETAIAHSAAPAEPTKTLHYHQNNIHDFAWFADRHFYTAHDTLQLASGRIIDVYSFYTPSATPAWHHSIGYIKDAVRFRSALVGEYPFNVVTAVQAWQGDEGGMEYPTITVIHLPKGKDKELDLTIEHEVGHNWFYAVLGTDERRYPWMDEGINSYYDNRYTDSKYPASDYPKWLAKKIPADGEPVLMSSQAAIHLDQPISTPSEDFTVENYELIAYTKTAVWMKLLQDSLGTVLFDSCMREYFRTWQFRHPYPDDFKAVITNTSHINLDPLFRLLDTTGRLPPFPSHRPIRPTLLFNYRKADKIDFLNILPAAGFNNYDHFMIGAIIHNFNLPPDNWQLLAAPLYAIGSHQLNGLLHVNHAWYPHHSLRLIEAGINASRFSTISGADSNSRPIFGGFYKVVPYLRMFFPKSSPRSTQDSWLEWRTYLIGEKSFNNYVLKSTDSLYYPTAGKYEFRYLNQLSFTILDSRVLYPYSINLQVQQAAPFYRFNLNVNYRFNYESTGGLDVRLFGAKFGYLGTRNPAQDLTAFEPKLTADRGNDDYTYDNYFVGRNDYSGLASQQIMMRDGDLKLRTDLFQGLQGRSDNWVAAVNLKSTIPSQIIPNWLPLRLFLDVGTYAQAWSDNPPTSHFLYVGGLELDLLHNVLCIYAPLIYSSDFSSQLKTVVGQNGFFQKVSFSIDFKQIPFRKWFGYTPF
jgi:Peptidase family M1 domain